MACFRQLTSLTDESCSEVYNGGEIGGVKMPDESDWRRADVAQWIGTLLWIVLLESHVVSRPLVFLLGPFIVLLSFVTIAFPVPRKRLRQMCLFALATSISGFLLM